ncbi:MAG: alpha/beta hydrolase [Acidimicrobiia bacterium]|nr:alpha/beta hydrolase [Acidimicrobiia bacterium]
MHCTYVTLEDTTINLQDHGGEGPPLLLIHGLGGSAGNWARVADPLARHARVVALDLPGHGRSGPAPVYTLDHHVDVVRSAIGHLGWRDVSLMGNSMGALIAMLVAGRHSELVRSLILLSPATPPVGPTVPADPVASARLVGQSLPAIGPAIARRYLASRTPTEQIDETLRIVMAAPEQLPSEIRDDAVELARLRRTMPWALDAFAGSAASIRRFFTRAGAYRMAVDAVDAPTTMIFGGRDRVVIPESFRWLARRRLDWRCIELADVGHVPMLERPDIVVRETARLLRQAGEPDGPDGSAGVIDADRTKASAT